MSPEIQMFTCPRCQRGEFRSLAGPGGKAYCPWCGDAVEAKAPAPEPEPGPPLEQFSLEELASKLSGQPAQAPAVTVSSATPAPAPAKAPSPSHPALEARLAEAERRRDVAEAELKKELDKKKDIKNAVKAEIGRLEAELAESHARVRRKDEEHAAALETLNVLKQAKQQEWDGEEMRLRSTVNGLEKTRQDLETALEALKKSSAGAQGELESARADAAILRSDYAAADAERAELRRKLNTANARLHDAKDAAARLKDVEKKLQEAQSKSAALQADLDKRDQRIKELQMLIKTLGERLNQLSDRRMGAH